MSETAVANTEVWKKVCKVPKEALKEIGAGRLKGMSDINPQWRIMVMTEIYGPCGIGWKYTIDKLWTEQGAPVKAKDADIREPEIMAFALVSVYVRHEDKNLETGYLSWSEPIQGIGGSMMTAMEKSGPYNSDECYKMAVTDALSVALKALGVGANVYLGSKFQSKFDREEQLKTGFNAITEEQAFIIESLIKEVNADIDKFCIYFKIGMVKELPATKYESAVKSLESKRSVA